MTPSPNNKYEIGKEMESYTNENSSLLPTDSGNDYGNNGDEDNDVVFAPLEDRTNSFSEMKKTVHNDPGLSQQYESVEDFQTLLGSTSVLKNALDQEGTTSWKSIQKRSHSFTMLLPTREIEEPSIITLEAKGHRRTGSISSRISDNGNGMYSHREDSPLLLRMERLYQSRISNVSTLYLKKIKKSFFSDAKSLAEGTIPQSIVLAIVIGIVCGVACYFYYSILYFGLDLFWTKIPEEYIIPSEFWSPEYYWLWIPLVCFSMVTLVGLTVFYMGEPGDLPYTISRVHTQAYIPMDHVLPMVFASMFSILGKLYRRTQCS